MRLGRTIARSLFHYDLYRIYSCKHATAAPPGISDALTLAAIQDPLDPALTSDDDLRRLRGYTGDEAQAFGAWWEGELAGVCWYWWGALYRTRNFWPLGDGEAKLVQVTVAKPFRGRGIAGQLIAYSAAEMMRRGFGVLYARIWHSHSASIAAFETAGWVPVAFVAEVAVRGFTKRLRVVRPLGRDRRG
jgi:GNAT superfamily N-acetyltransferase